jgi:hypothetical protein
MATRESHTTSRPVGACTVTTAEVFSLFFCTARPRRTHSQRQARHWRPRREEQQDDE